MDGDRAYINTLRGALMVLVVLGHFLQIIEWSAPTGLDIGLRAVIILIYSFHMPLFIALSGYLSTNPDKRREYAFADLFLPYILFQLVFGVLNIPSEVFGEVLENIFLPQFGLWYLLALFIWRITLKDIVKIKGVFWISIALNVCTCFFSGIGKEMSMQRVLGFGVFFLTGYYLKIKGWPIKRLPTLMALFIFVAEIIGFSFIPKEIYQNILDILTHRILMADYAHWYIAPLIYIAAIIIAVINSWLFISIIPKHNNILIHIGTDTLPIYISHLATYIVVTRLPGPEIIHVTAAIIAIPISLFMFTAKWYTHIFNCVVTKTIGLVYKKAS